MSSNDNAGLGRSLSNVFARTKRRDPPAPKGHLEVALERCAPSGKNPRQGYDEEALQELAESIRLHGILQPLTVRRAGDGFEIIAGERRWRAAEVAGLAKVPVVVRDEADEQNLAELRLIENIQREDLNAIELAAAYQKLIDDHGLTQEEVARRVGKDRSSVGNALRLLALAPALQKDLVEGRLAAGHAKALLGLPDQESQRLLARRIRDEGLSVREVEQLVRRWDKRTRGKAKEPPPHIKELETNLYRLFGAPVKVKERGGKGTLTVSFNSKQSFQRIIEVLGKAINESRRTTGS